MQILPALRRRRQARAIADLESKLQAAEDRHRPRILAQLATRYEAVGRDHDADGAYQEVLVSRDPDFAARAALWLGAAREAAGSATEAEAFFEQATLFRTEEAFQAAYALARLRLRRGSLDAARRSLRFAATSADLDLARSATMSLSAIAEEGGNDWGARTLRERAERLRSL